VRSPCRCRVRVEFEGDQECVPLSALVAISRMSRGEQGQ